MRSRWIVATRSAPSSIVSCGAVLQRLVDVLVVRLVVLALDRERRDAVLGDQRGGDVVLRAERVAGAERELGAAVAQRERQVRRLGGDVEAGREADAAQRLLLREALADRAEDRHLARRPLDAPHALLGQARVLDVAVQSSP